MHDKKWQNMFLINVVKSLYQNGINIYFSISTFSQCLLRQMFKGVVRQKIFYLILILFRSTFHTALLLNQLFAIFHALPTSKMNILQFYLNTSSILMSVSIASLTTRQSTCSEITITHILIVQEFLKPMYKFRYYFCLMTLLLLLLLLKLYYPCQCIQLFYKLLSVHTTLYQSNYNLLHYMWSNLKLI